VSTRRKSAPSYLPHKQSGRARAVWTDSTGERHQKLSKPGYAYLIAFRPDGVTELCFPADEGTPPSLTDTPRYPLADGLKAYGLREGTGLWVFAVVASEKPLPSYRSWQQQRFGSTSPWTLLARLPAGFVWRDACPNHRNPHANAFLFTRTSRSAEAYVLNWQIRTTGLFMFDLKREQFEYFWMAKTTSVR